MSEGTIFLDEVINNYISECDYPDSSFERLQSLAIRSYRLLHLHATGKPRTEEMEVLANKTSKLPCDFMTKLSIGVLSNDGNIVSLSEEPNLGLISDGSRLTNPTSDFTSTTDFENGYPTLNIGNNLGSGSRSDIGFYRIDFDNLLVIYNPDFQYDTVHIEYLPIAGTDGDEYIIDPRFQEAVVSFLGWKDRKKSLQERAKSEQEFWNWLRIGKASVKPFDPSDAYNSYRKMISQAPRA